MCNLMHKEKILIILLSCLMNNDDMYGTLLFYDDFFFLNACTSACYLVLVSRISWKKWTNSASLNIPNLVSKHD